MKIYYTGADIEELAASGVTRLELGPGVAITDVARELAEQLGIALVTPGPALPASHATPAPASPGSLPARPRGCQHGPLTGSAGGPAPADGQGGPGRPEGVVGRLVNMVSRLADQGG